MCMTGDILVHSHITLQEILSHSSSLAWKYYWPVITFYLSFEINHTCALMHDIVNIICVHISVGGRKCNRSIICSRNGICRNEVMSVTEKHFLFSYILTLIQFMLLGRQLYIAFAYSHQTVWLESWSSNILFRHFSNILVKHLLLIQLLDQSLISSQV